MIWSVATLGLYLLSGKFPFPLLAVVVFFCCVPPAALPDARSHHFLFYSSEVELLQLFQDQVFIIFLLEKTSYFWTLALLRLILCTQAASVRCKLNTRSLYDAGSCCSKNTQMVKW